MSNVQHASEPSGLIDQMQLQQMVGGHTDTRNCCTITRTGSGLVDDLRYLLMGIFLAAVMFSGYVYPFKWLFPIFKTARNIWNAGDILYNHILLHPVIH
jgi:hypothetical protein